LNAASGLVDWGLAERTAETMIGGLGPIGRPPASQTDRYRADELAATCEAAISVAAGYAGLGAVADPPPAELIDRRTWARVALGSLAEAVRPVELRLGAQLGGAGPLGPVARGVLGAGAGVEAGIAVGYAGRRVLGQYDVALFDPERPARLLLVGPNLDSARLALAADRDLFLFWLALHETTHVIQFERVPWLAGHIRGLVDELIESATGALDERQVGRLARRLIRDPRELLRAALRGELARVLAEPAGRETFERLQATMSVIEGHAEHVMDAAAPERPGLPELRRRLDQRRASRSGLGDVLARLLGFDLKLRQYALGKAFCDGVVEHGGVDAVRLVWRSPADLPTLDELAGPRGWLERVTEHSPQPA
jgi:coenzyme F420 biosynthesis associated uncharacterized protein